MPRTKAKTSTKATPVKTAAAISKTPSKTLAPNFNYGSNTAATHVDHQQSHDELHISESGLRFCWCMCKKCWDKQGRRCICSDCNCGSFQRSVTAMQP